MGWMSWANGFTTDGGFAEYAINNVNTMVHIPNDMPDAEATLIVTAGTAMYGLDVMGEWLHNGWRLCRVCYQQRQHDGPYSQRHARRRGDADRYGRHGNVWAGCHGRMASQRMAALPSMLSTTSTRWSIFPTTCQTQRRR